MTAKTDDPVDVAGEVNRLNQEAIKGLNKVTKDAGKIAEKTSTYDPQRENPPDWLKPNKKS